MASSRWKRFAFFDRKNLPLPPLAIKDLIPPSLSGSRPSCPSDVDGASDAASLHPEEIDASKIGVGEYFSLSACAARLDGRSTTDGGIERNSAGEGVAAMLSGHLARSPDGADVGSVSLQLAFASSRNTSLIHCVDVTARCSPIHPPSGSGGGAAEGGAEELDGWRGYFRPFDGRGPPPGGAGGRSGAPRPPARSREQRISEEHVGSESASGDLFASSPFRSDEARIVAVDACAHDGALYLASATDARHTSGIVVHADPHLKLETTLPPPPSSSGGRRRSAACRPRSFDFSKGNPRCVSLRPGVVCVGTDAGVVLVYVFDAKRGSMGLAAEIPAPRGGGERSDREGRITHSVSGVELIAPDDAEGTYRLFVSYRKREEGASTAEGSAAGGVCCYDLGGLRVPGSKATLGATGAPAVSARRDLDGRGVAASCLCGGISVPDSLFPDGAEKATPRYAVARGDGLHLYSCAEKVGVCPVDGSKIGMCSLPRPPATYLKRRRRRPGEGSGGEAPRDSSAGATYVLVASTDGKAGRDAVDIYDTSNRLVGFHALLSPGHRALRTAGTMSPPEVKNGALVRGGRASAVVFTSGGSIVTLTEKVTPDKVALLVQKQLYPAAISMAFSDPAFYRPEDITGLYRRYAEHLYRKGDFAAAMDQYILTIGSLESSHVIFRYLDAPKIPLVVKYLEALRAQGLASSVHDEMLRTCYLKLNDHESASKIISSPSSAVDGTMAPPLNPDGSEVPTVSISRNLLACADDPSEMLAAVCSLEAREAAEALVAHGPMLARSLARETAGVVVALCDGTYSPTALADAAAGRAVGSSPTDGDGKGSKCDKYPISLFANVFLENPKLFRLILSHCRRNDCVLTPMLRRTLLELTLDEWNSAKRTGDGEVEKLRHDEAITMLSESQADEMGDYEALVIVQAAGFLDGEILLYERLNMVPMMLEQYARSGNERARRHMLAMCEHDPELFAEVLAHFVSMAGEKLNKDCPKDEVSVGSDTETGGLLHDIHEALVLARDHGNSIPPVRVLRILAGEGFGQFSSSDTHGQESHSNRCSVPLSVAMDYVGATLDESSRKIQRLQNNVVEYNRLCCEMEMEIEALLSSGAPKKDSEGGHRTLLPNIDIDEMYSNLCELAEDSTNPATGRDQNLGSSGSKEEFWREMEHSDDPFETMCFFLAKGYLDNI